MGGAIANFFSSLLSIALRIIIRIITRIVIRIITPMIIRIIITLKVQKSKTQGGLPRIIFFSFFSGRGLRGSYRQFFFLALLV